MYLIATDMYPSTAPHRTVQPGAALNYPEVVVYREEAALPTHLIVYALLD